MKKFFTAVTFAAMCLFVASAQADTTTVGFDGGSDDGFTGNFVFESAGGNPGGNAHMVPVGNFFPSLRTGGMGEPTNPAFIGDFSSFDSVTFSFDVVVNSLTDFIGNPTFRPIGVMLLDHDIQGNSGSAGVFYEMTVLGSAIQSDWTTYSVTFDPTSATLPDGWIGRGDEDPNTFEPLLPNGATFADVLAGVDEFQLTGAVPGFQIGFGFVCPQVGNQKKEQQAG